MIKLLKKLLLLVVIGLVGQASLNANAGVLPYSFKPGTNELVFLTGSLRRPDPRGSVVSDFGGIREAEEAWEHNAAREFNEETLFFFARKLDTRGQLRYNNLYSTDRDTCHRTQEQAHQLIAQKLRGCFYVDNGRGYRMYLMYVDFTRASNISEERRKLQARRSRREIGQLNGDECIHFNWIKYQDITTQVQNVLTDQVDVAFAAERAQRGASTIKLFLRQCLYRSIVSNKGIFLCDALDEHKITNDRRFEETAQLIIGRLGSMS